MIVSHFLPCNRFCIDVVASQETTAGTKTGMAPSMAECFDAINFAQVETKDLVTHPPRYYHYWERRIFNAITTMLLRGQLQIHCSQSVLRQSPFRHEHVPNTLQCWWAQEALFFFFFFSIFVQRTPVGYVSKWGTFPLKPLASQQNFIATRPPLLRVKADCSGSEIDDQALQSATGIFYRTGDLLLLHVFLHYSFLVAKNRQGKLRQGLPIDQQAAEEHHPIGQEFRPLDGWHVPDGAPPTGARRWATTNVGGSKKATGFCAEKCGDLIFVF